MRKDKHSLELLYEEDDFVVMNKASGLLVHRGWGNDPVVALDLVQDHVGRKAYPVHRLDRATSGPLLVATRQEMARALGMMFDQRAMEKRYFAFVRGITPEAGTIDHPIPRQKGGPRVDAVTHFTRVATFERYSLVEAHPMTGRLHQVRRHLKHITHPLIGDTKYGKTEHTEIHRQRFNLRRMALHCWVLRLHHPLTQVPLTFVAPMPADLTEPFARMGIPAESWESRCAAVLAEYAQADAGPRPVEPSDPDHVAAPDAEVAPDQL